MSRRVPSAKARKSWLSDSSLSLLNTTIWLYDNRAQTILQIVTTGIVFQRDRAIAGAREKHETRPLARRLEHFWLENRTSVRVWLLKPATNLFTWPVNYSQKMRT